MPDLGGRDLYNAVVREFPAMLGRVGFITGDTMGKASQGLLKETDCPHLEKPVSPSELLLMVRKLSKGQAGSKNGARTDA